MGCGDLGFFWLWGGSCEVKEKNGTPGSAVAEVALWVLREGSAGADTSAGQPGTGMLHCPFCTLMD